MMKNLLNKLSCCFSIFIIIVICVIVFIFFQFRNSWILNRNILLQKNSDSKIVKQWKHQKEGTHVFPAYLSHGVSNLTKLKTVVKNPNHLVFSGGGARGPAYAGVLKYLQEKNMLKNVNSFVGTSAGSIMCTFMSVGSYYEKNRLSKEKPFWKVVYEIIEETDFIDFIDNPILKEFINKKSFNSDNLIASIQNVSSDMGNHYALCQGSKIESFFKQSLIKFGFKENITLGELYRKTGKHLILVSCSLSYDKIAYFDYKTAPDLQVAKAMRASMAIPFVFAPVKYNNDFFVDGGAAYNYPIDYFDSITSVNDLEPAVLGIALFSKKEMLRPSWNKVENFFGYSGSVCQLVMFNTSRAINQINFSRTVFIDCGKIGVMSFSLSKKQKRELIQAGYDSMVNYYRTKSN